MLSCHLQDAMKTESATETPLYCLNAFSPKADKNLFYIENLQQHLISHSFVSQPHRHDFYLLLYIKTGGGTHTIDFIEYAIEPNSFFVMTPGQVHHWNLEQGTDGFILFFTPEFYRLGLTENSLYEFPFFHSLQPQSKIKLANNTTKFIEVIITEMHYEFGSGSLIDLRMLRSYLDVLLLKIAREYVPVQIDPGNNEQTIRMRKLEQLIDRHFKKMKQPSQYADMMHLSASYLNSICKHAVGKTLSDLIFSRVILEAKRLFSYSDLSVNEVAARLGFNQPSYFVRFFKKETSLTPDQFKESLNRAV